VTFSLSPTHRWHYWPIYYRWLSHHAYSLGLCSAGSESWDDDGHHGRIHWRGKRCYFLYWPRRKWRCVLKFHHWPTPWVIGFGLCGKCCPWPCCGAITIGHKPGCLETNW
jgi:hypothetical protein